MKSGRKRRGPLSGAPPDGEPWTWILLELLMAPTFGALGIAARRILDLLLVEHTSHAGRENGKLAATYLQLEAFGLTKADIRKGFAELEATGFVRLTEQGLRQAGGGEPSRYALTWYPTKAGSPHAVEASHDWRKILYGLRRAGITTVRAVRLWLRAQTAEHSRSRKQGPPAPDIEGAPQMRADGRLQVRGKASGNVFPLKPQVRGGGGGK